MDRGIRRFQGSQQHIDSEGRNSAAQQQGIRVRRRARETVRRSRRSRSMAAIHPAGPARPRGEQGNHGRRPAEGERHGAREGRVRALAPPQARSPGLADESRDATRNRAGPGGAGGQAPISPGANRLIAASKPQWLPDRRPLGTRAAAIRTCRAADHARETPAGSAPRPRRGGRATSACRRCAHPEPRHRMAREAAQAHPAPPPAGAYSPPWGGCSPFRDVLRALAQHQARPRDQQSLERPRYRHEQRAGRGRTRRGRHGADCRPASHSSTHSGAPLAAGGSAGRPRSDAPPPGNDDARQDRRGCRAKHKARAFAERRKKSKRKKSDSGCRNWSVVITA